MLVKRGNEKINATLITRALYERVGAVNFFLA